MRPIQFGLPSIASTPAPATQPNRSVGVPLDDSVAPTGAVEVCNVCDVESSRSQARPAVPYSSTLSAGSQPRRLRTLPRYCAFSLRVMVVASVPPAIKR
ncbi:hypothetical protein ACVWWG_008059 [Bradyrhizobium sp. LB7.2]